jgi:flagellar assembly factor FliW
VKFKATRFGEIEIADELILSLPEGLIGFPECNKVILIDHQPGSPFRWLQSVIQPELAFVVIDPLDLVPDYPLEKLKDILETERKMRRPKSVAVAAITTVPTPPAHITVNLTAPVVFDSDTRQGAQIILHDPRFKTRHLLVQEPKSSSKNEAVENG